MISLAGCGGSGDPTSPPNGGGFPSNVKKLRFNADVNYIMVEMQDFFDGDYGGEGDFGFTVKVNGKQIPVWEAKASDDQDFILINAGYDNEKYDFRTDNVVLLSYSGNTFPGLSAFTDQTCTLSSQ
jgi:hypothetical protein